MHHWELRQQIIDMCLSMNANGLNQGTSGNISARYGDYMLITPSGIPYDKLGPGDICRMSLKHNRYEWKGPHKPSSEWHFHRAILQSREDFGAVIHTHSTYATVLSIAGQRIPACHYMIAAFGGKSVRCADYATYGTAELSSNILEAMRNRTACLMANHGMVVAGADLDKTMWAAVELETLSKQFYLAQQLDGMVILPDDEMARVAEGFKSYGPSQENSDSKSRKKNKKNNRAAEADPAAGDTASADKPANGQLPRVNIPRRL